jgi:hypothetical protein
MATFDDDTVSAGLAGFTDPEVDERERWSRLEREAVLLCEPLARLLGHKKICDVTDVSMGQLSRELSPHYDTNLSLKRAVFITRETQNERLAQIIVCDGLGARMPEWQKRKVSEGDELRALRAEVREMGATGQVVLDRAARRARSGR